MLGSIRWMMNHSGGFPIKKFFNDILIGHFHMWYCWLIIVLYLLIPLLREVAKNEALLKYSLILIIIGSFTFPYLAEVYNVTWLSAFIENVPDITHAGFIGYYLLGYYLYSREIDFKKEVLWYVLGAIGMVTAIGGTIYSSYIMGEYSSRWAYTSLPVLLQSIGIFVLFRKHANKMQKNKQLEQLKIFLSKQTFGIYLIHVFWMEVLFMLFNRLIGTSAIMIILVIMGTFMLTALQVFVMSKIPIISKYLL